ncbi:HER129Cp [Eremothecium sinecaudum]|uniref:HER129Cp n=1 Tax=Eremothecium sinecaudum TaxID=45286 RepID=A0A120K2F8_9SACH|nr:HER129Cp [Eremothecium sinecaudum]AMD21408.1 HER129Cp [Eremothecium sinecaudum]
MPSLIDCILLRNINYHGRVYDKFPKTYNVVVIAFAACITGLMFGFDISSMSSMIGTEVYYEYFNRPSAEAQGGITSAMSAGSFVGSLLSSSVSDAFGRRVSLHSCGALWLIGSVLQCAAQNQAMLIVGRVISGMGIGFGSAIAPVYCAEIAPPKIRGAICSIFQLSVTIGIMILFFVGYGAQHLESTAAFRITWGAQLVPGFALVAVVFFIPESPRWLAVRGRWDDAHNVVAKVTANGDLKDEDVLLQMVEIQEQVHAYEVSKSFGYRDLFRGSSLRKTVVGVSAQMWQQLSGVNVMMYYIVYLFEMAGFSGNTNLISASIQYVLNVVMTIPALLLVDRIGRRPLLIVGGIAMSACLLTVAGLLGRYSIPVEEGFRGNDSVRITIPEEYRSAAVGVIACAYLFVCSFAFTWGVGIWLYCSEIFNNNERAKGSALSASVNWAFNFALAMFVPSAFRDITWKTYIIFGVFAACMAVYTYLLFPETKSRTLEEIDQMWASGIPAWRSKSFVPQKPLLGQEKKPTDFEGDISNEESTDAIKQGRPNDEEDRKTP